ncbi:hypothetical protein GQ602_004272 [Ophiocordyceps camponoti-floridani]|uniref:Uncharacterized protein n=1 Tax=Ophiocordyceps camponoti-floridani TaxID=2030778 RepID=A0A8H4Q6F5_9HYPO|nr:hypothetical protein GQ602_004272 [Ophiocordyceps camponoti-floridani]
MTATFTHESAASRLRGRINGIDGHITRPSPTAYPTPITRPSPTAYPTPLEEETKVPDTTGKGRPASHDADPPPRVSKGKLIVALPAHNTTGEATDAFLMPRETADLSLQLYEEAPDAAEIDALLAPGPTPIILDPGPTPMTVLALLPR